MELQQLRYLVAVARAGSFGRAATQCRVSQPSLSQQIQKLEEELGEPVFQRTAKGAVLTNAGAALVRRAVLILRELDEAVTEARDAGKMLKGRVTIGAIPTISPYLLPQVVAEFAACCPGVEVVLHEDTTAQLIQKIASMEIDLGLASLPIESSEVETRPLFSEELLLALPPNHSLTKKRAICMADLETERFILMKEGHCLGAQALNLCRQAKLEPNVVLRSAQIETIRGLVGAGFGISLIPAMARVHGNGHGLVYRSLKEPRPKRDVVICYRKGGYLSRAALRLMDVLRAVELRGRS